MFRQAKWPLKNVFEYRLDEEPISKYIDIEELSKYIPKRLIRRSKINFPKLSEFDVVRHYTRLSQHNYGVDLGIYPLGSCTMKYNPRFNEHVASTFTFKDIHPDTPEKYVQGVLEIIYELSGFLASLTGMDYFSLQPAAGAQGEFVGVLIMKKYFEMIGEERDEIIIPDTAHGTNPASARMGGFKIIEVPSDNRGMLSLSMIKNVVGDRTAGLMLTNPNTLGIFEEDILEIADFLHENGSLLYYDGANLNAIMGWIKPGDMGFDIVHVNLHKTFSTPHGGGGPGAGPVGVKKHLRDFLPVPIVEKEGDRYKLVWDLRHTIGKVHSYFGNFLVLLRAYLYIRLMGFDGLKKASSIAVLNSNYVFKKVRNLRGVSPYPDNDKFRMHEFVISLDKLKRDTGVSARDFSKRIIDYGVYAPTTYFPLIVPEALMIEPTETVSKDALDTYIDVLSKVVEEAYDEPSKVINSPVNTSVGRIDEAYGSRLKTFKPTFRWKGLRR